MAVALAAPLKVTVEPLPPVTVPEMVQVAVDVKFTVETLAPLTVTARLTGMKLNPVLLGVTVYEPLASPGKL